MRKAAAYVDIPVRAVMTAAPPRMSMALTMMLVKKQKKKKTCSKLDVLKIQQSDCASRAA